MARASKTFSILVLVLVMNLGVAAMATASQGPMIIAGVTAASLDSAVKKIRKQTKGKIMSQKQVGSHFHIKVLLPNGKVKIYKVKKK